MNNFNDGGPAFPISDLSKTQFTGISLRDHIAINALHGILSIMKDWDLLSYGDYSPEEDTPKKEIARVAYEIADAMIAERIPEIKIDNRNGEAHHG
jgi:hypothetical protein